ncbi:MAG: Aspartate kinase [Bacteroidota bacterium]|jgi:aspartate kinase
MQVWKFGGTSVGKPERMHSIKKLITEDNKSKIVVLSALSGSTNSLISISESVKKREIGEANIIIENLYQHYQTFLSELYSTAEGLEKGKAIVEKEFSRIKELIQIEPYSVKQEKEMVAMGELLSTQMFTAYLEEEKVEVKLIPALEYMVIDGDGEPILKKIEEKIKVQLDLNNDRLIYITQGFICRNPEGEIDNLKRGGSDYTASLVGAAILAEEVQIWTDIDGMHNNDPRIVKKTFPIRELSFEEAAELAYFGAKILHPSTITPSKIKGVPVRLKNTMEPQAYGTLISEKTNNVEFKAIAAKDDITAIYIHSTRMLNAYGFLRKVFEIFEKYKTPVDMITTSEVSVSVTIDNTKNFDKIMADLSEFSDLEECDSNQVIICIVGNFSADKEGIAIKVLKAMENIPIRMISYGASEHNISILVDAKYKADALNALNDGLFF